jgi:hypothetical protein
MKDKEKIMIEIITIPIEDAVVLAKAILAAEDAEEASVDAVEEETIVSILKMWNVSIVAKRVTIPLTAHSQEKMTMISQTWFPNLIAKPCSNPH